MNEFHFPAHSHHIFPKTPFPPHLSDYNPDNNPNLSFYSAGAYCGRRSRVANRNAAASVQRWRMGCRHHSRFALVSEAARSYGSCSQCSTGSAKNLDGRRLHRGISMDIIAVIHQINENQEKKLQNSIKYSKRKLGKKRTTFLECNQQVRQKHYPSWPSFCKNQLNFVKSRAP